MNLREYLFYAELTAKQFAQIADLTPGYISVIMKKRLTPTAKTMRVIEKATGGHVTADTISQPTKVPDNFLML